MFTCQAVINLFKGLKDPSQRACLNAASRILHFKTQQHAALGLLHSAAADLDRTLFGEFDCGAGVGEHRLAQAGFITEQRFLRHGTDFTAQRNSTFLCLRAQQRNHVIHYSLRRDRLLFQGHVPGLDAGVLQDGVEQAEQVFPR